MYYNQTIIITSDNLVYVICNYSIIFLIIYCFAVSFYSCSCKYRSKKNITNISDISANNYIIEKNDNSNIMDENINRDENDNDNQSLPSYKEIFPN